VNGPVPETPDVGEIEYVIVAPEVEEVAATLNVVFEI
jgi:hypothetical protein